jgi:translation initiation factor IF-2
MLRLLIAGIMLSATVALAPSGAQTPAPATPPAAQPPGAPSPPAAAAPAAPGAPTAPGAPGAAGGKVEAPAPEPPSPSRKVFRWVDKDGVIHYSDAPPQHEQQPAPPARQGRQR